MSDLIFVGQFVASKTGATGLTVTVDVDRYTLSDGSRSALVTGGSATEGRRGLYHYRLASADLSLYQYVATFITADSSVDQQEIAALGLVVPDALTSSREVAGAAASAAGAVTLATGRTGDGDDLSTLTFQGVRDAMRMAASHLVPIEDDSIDALLVALNGGPGASSKRYTVLVSGSPRAGAYCRLCTDAACETAVSAGTSNSLGQVTFRHDLPAGTPPPGPCTAS